MLETITGREYAEILAFAAHEPLNEIAADERAAMQTFITARAGGGREAQLEHFSRDREKPWQDPTEQEQTQDEMDRAMMKIAGLFQATTAVR